MWSVTVYIVGYVCSFHGPERIKVVCNLRVVHATLVVRVGLRIDFYTKVLAFTDCYLYLSIF